MAAEGAMAVGLVDMIRGGGLLGFGASDCSNEARKGLVFAGFKVVFTGVPFVERASCGEGRAGDGSAEPVLGFRKGLLELRLRDKVGDEYCSIRMVRIFCLSVGGDNAHTAHFWQRSGQ